MFPSLHSATVGFERWHIFLLSNTSLTFTQGDQVALKLTLGGFSLLTVPVIPATHILGISRPRPSKAPTQICPCQSSHCHNRTFSSTRISLNGGWQWYRNRDRWSKLLRSPRSARNINTDAFTARQYPPRAY